MRRLMSLLLVLFAVACLLGPSEPAHALITWTGNVDPADPTTWTTSTDGYIGRTANGTLTVDGASELLSNDGTIGHDAGVSGAVTVTGSGSKWESVGELSLGHATGGKPLTLG